MIGFVERGGKVDTQHIVKGFGLSTWNDELFPEVRKTEREASLGGGLNLGLQLWTG